MKRTEEEFRAAVLARRDALAARQQRRRRQAAQWLMGVVCLVSAAAVTAAVHPRRKAVSSEETLSSGYSVAMDDSQEPADDRPGAADTPVEPPDNCKNSTAEDSSRTAEAAAIEIRVIGQVRRYTDRESIRRIAAVPLPEPSDSPDGEAVQIVYTQPDGSTETAEFPADAVKALLLLLAELDAAGQ